METRGARRWVRRSGEVGGILRLEGSCFPPLHKPPTGERGEQQGRGLERKGPGYLDDAVPVEMVRRCGGLNRGRGNTKLDTARRKERLKDENLRTGVCRTSCMPYHSREMATAEGLLLGIPGGVRRGSEYSKTNCGAQRNGTSRCAEGSGLDVASRAGQSGPGLA
jgi:hypothetical protein